MGKRNERIEIASSTNGKVMRETKEKKKKMWTERDLLCLAGASSAYHDARRVQATPSKKPVRSTGDTKKNPGSNRREWSNLAVIRDPGMSKYFNRISRFGAL